MKTDHCGHVYVRLLFFVSYFQLRHPHMARTQFSARKVTGGSAPRSSWRRAPTVNRKTSTPQAHQVSRPEEPALNNGEGNDDAENVSSTISFPRTNTRTPLDVLHLP